MYRAKDEEAGEVPMAFVVKRHSSLLSEDAILNYVSKQVLLLTSTPSEAP